MKTAGIIVNTTRLREQPEMAAQVRTTIDTLLHHGGTVWLDVDGARMLGVADQGRSDDELAARAEIIIAFGGDGTILRAARLAARRSIPILGVNLGGFGFLAEISTDDLPGALPDLLAGHYELDERMMLQVQTDHAEEQPWLALNDVVVTKSGVARVLRLRVLVNGEHLASYPADGVIVATPTGSTAYSLSAGGPILHPNVDALVITPICPHTFNARSVVVDGNAAVEIALTVPSPEAIATVDGRVGVPLGESWQVRVRRAPQTTRFVRVRNSSFYGILRTKLAWGER
ncbi:MAG: NAD(+)/NADH kinase [Bacillati bacterium ANGP1]|uniref:NAD kinase n=1 Tax=Candidatus Segetimicrobium genomatis TaxID=2569760 RepID=A0A537IV19_9BACT|nr:MAG: NAD(+)/NADH kinase [Terrabacteria group bacterium ANGP1]